MLVFRGFFHLFPCKVSACYVWNITARFCYQSYASLINELQNVSPLFFGRVCIKYVFFLSFIEKFLEKVTLPEELFFSLFFMLYFTNRFDLFNYGFNLKIIGKMAFQISLRT